MLKFLKGTLIFILKCFKRPGEITEGSGHFSHWWQNSKHHLETGQNTSQEWPQIQVNCLQWCTPDQREETKPVLEYGPCTEQPKTAQMFWPPSQLFIVVSFPIATTHLRCSLPKSWQSPAISTQRMSRWVISRSGCLSFSERTRHPARWPTLLQEEKKEI